MERPDLIEMEESVARRYENLTADNTLQLCHSRGLYPSNQQDATAYSYEDALSTFTSLAKLLQSVEYDSDSYNTSRSHDYEA